MKPSDAAPLQPPGAGLPLPELLLARCGFFLYRLRDPEQVLRHFAREVRAIRGLAAHLTPNQAARVVLIPRVFGIEDSSRAWSVNMTIDHLVIVDELIIHLITALTAGTTLPMNISTADVKPRQYPEPDIAERFGKVAADYARLIENAASLHTRAAQLHPWFGPLDAHGWHCLAAVHHRIHRRQIERIIAGLPQV